MSVKLDSPPLLSYLMSLVASDWHIFAPPFAVKGTATAHQSFSTSRLRAGFAHELNACSKFIGQKLSDWECLRDRLIIAKALRHCRCSFTRCGGVRASVSWISIRNLLDRSRRGFRFEAVGEFV